MNNMRKRIPDFEEELEVERVEEKEGLPPRSEIHRNKEKKQKFKMNHIFVRVLTFLSYYYQLVSYGIQINIFR